MKVNTFTKLAIGLGVVALSVAGVVVPAQADPSGPSSTALVGLGSDTTQDVMDEIASTIGGGKLASYRSIIGPNQTEYVQTRPGGPTNVIRAKGSGDGYRMLTVAEGSAVTADVGTLKDSVNRVANKANAVGQIDFARVSSKQSTANLQGEYVNVPFAIDSMGIAVNPQDAVAKIPLEGLGTTGDAATKASVMSIWRCQARYVYINNISVGAGTVANTGVITKATHGLAVGDRVKFSGTMPTGLETTVNYYVKTVPSASTFTVSATKTGDAIVTGTGSVTITQTMGAANTFNSVGAAPTNEAPAPAGTTGYVISPLIAVFGSGTGAYFVKTIGRTEGVGFPASGDAGQNCISRKALNGETNIQEHEGYGVAERENSMVGYSIGQWASQTNSAITGVTNRTSGTVLLDFFPKAGFGDTTVAAGVFTLTAHGLAVGNEITFRSTGTLPAGIIAGTKYFVKTAPSVNTFTISATSGGTQITPAATPAPTGVLSTFKVLKPLVGSGATLAPNEGWTSDLQRVVYNIMPYRKAADPTNPLNEMFVGTGSLVCQQTAAILKMGFTPLSSTDPTNPNSCGSIVNANRSTAGVVGGSLVTGASIAAFSSATAEVGIAKRTTVKIGTSNHQMGGTVQVLDAAIGTAGVKVLGSVSVAAGVTGTTDTDIDVTITKPGSTTLYAYFIPALGAIQVTPLLWGGTEATTTLTASAGEANVSLSIRKPSGIGGTGRAIAIVQGPVAPGGTVELFRSGVFPVLTGATSDTINTFTLANTAAGAAFTKTAAAVHGLAAGNPVKFSGTCPAAVKTDGTTYFVSATGLTTTAFRVSATAGGTAIATATATGDTCVITKVTPTVFTKAAHGLAVGNRVTLTGTLPTGFSADTVYFVATAPSVDTFTLAATSGGAGIVATANGTGTYSVTNTTPLASGTLAEGETAELLSYTQSAASMSIFARYVSADGSLTPSNSRAVVVTVPKLTATLASTLPAAPNGFTAGTAPAFANAVQRVQVGAAATTTATVSIPDDTFSITAHGLTAGSVVRFTGTTLPAGVTANTNYWVISSGLTTAVFKVSDTEGGSAIDITSAGSAVKVFRNNAAPRVTLTATGQSGATATPSGTIKVYIGASAVDRSREIQITGAQLAAATSGVAGAATATLQQAALWSGLSSVPAAGRTVYLIIDYSGDGVYGASSLNKQINLTPGS